MTPVACRHCGRNKADYGRRGLCWGCHQNPDVRAGYGMADVPTNRRGEGLHRGDNLPLPVPTAARAGTAEKMAVLAGRVRNREQLHHPGDGPDLS